MLKVRLQRVGRRNDPAFRAVVVESTQGPKTGRNLEIVGHHHPGQNKTELNGERILHWVGKGAQLSDTLHNLLIDKGILSGKKRDALPRKNSFKAEEKAAPSEAPKEAEPVAEASQEAPAPEAAPLKAPASDEVKPA